jgi:hypothetical protein
MPRKIAPATNQIAPKRTQNSPDAARQKLGLSTNLVWVGCMAMKSLIGA